MKRLITILFLFISLCVNAQVFTYYTNAVTTPSLPFDTTDCILWLEADYGITLNGTTVSKWADRSSVNDSCYQSTATSQPTFVASDSNGYPSISFDGGDYLLGTTIAGLNNSDISMFIVCRHPSTTGNRAVICISVTNYLFRRTSTNTGISQIYNNGVALDDAIAGSFLDAGVPNRVVSYIKVRNTSTTLYVNGTLSNTAIVGAADFTNNNYNLGRRSDNVNYWLGNISAVIIFKKAMNSTQRQAMETYLSNKYQ